MSTNHTPGPWKAFLGSGKINPSVRTANEIEESICALRTSVMRDRDRAEADALLIAAAPDLFAALIALVGSLSKHDGERLIEHAEPMIKARAAIAKAEGGADE